MEYPDDVTESQHEYAADDGADDFSPRWRSAGRVIRAYGYRHRERQADRTQDVEHNSEWGRVLLHWEIVSDDLPPNPVVAPNCEVPQRGIDGALYVMP